MKHRTTRTHQGLLRAVSIAQISLFVFSGIGCEPPQENQRTARIRQAVVGRDGARTITTAGTVVNAYGALAANATLGANTITVTNIADLATGGQAALSQGDLVLVIQMAGATINTADSTNYGDIINLNNAGRYEFVGVNSVAGNQITIACALRNSYSVAGKVQVIRVPQYTTLTINSSASIVPLTWNGTRGGVVAVHAESTVSLNGQIDVSGYGFRGGAIDNSSTAATTAVVLYRASNEASGGEKGEGVAGYGSDYDDLGGRYGRGAPANGGGGGNSHNAGGGGGANGRIGLSWTGQGVMLSTVEGGAQAWPLDPGYSGVLANSQGGGRGGYSYANSNQNALVVGPDSSAWSGNNRRQVGGLGGRPLDNDPTSRLFLGGGGGAGDGNNNSVGRGGNGGGLVFVIAGSVNGTGQILAKGQTGGFATLSPSDAAGGGGGGGTIVVNATSVSGISMDASGGMGGNQTNANGDETEGPGGGGGGGYIAVSGGAPTRVAAGGLGGTTNRPALAEFPSNGATAGNSGQIDGNATSFLYCGGLAIPNTFITTQTPALTNLTTATFTMTSPESPVTFECKLDEAAYEPCPSTTIIAALTEGSHTFYARAVNQSSNVDPTPATFAWTVDTTAPETSISQGPAVVTTSPTGTFTFASNDPEATFECSLDKATFVACPATFTTPSLPIGSHTLEVRAKDKAGNVDGTPSLFPWTIQASPDAGVIDASEQDAPMVDTATTDASDAVMASEVTPADVLPDTQVDLVPQDAPVVFFVDAGSLDASTERPLADTRPVDTRIADATPDTQRDTRPILDSEVVPPALLDAASIPEQDAAQIDENVVAMGGGFCTIAPTSNRSAWPFLMLAALGASLCFRRRRG